MKDWLKNLLLAGLLLVMLLLLAVTFFTSVRGSSGGRRLLRLEEEGDTFTLPEASTPIAYPEVLVLVRENGLFCAADSQNYTQLYQQIEPVYQEALGSAGAPQPMEESVYLAFLTNPALVVQYHAPVPLYLLQAWSGGEVLRDGLEVSGAALVLREEKVILLLTDGTGGRWQAATAASAENLIALCQWEGESNAVFAKDSALLPGDQVLTLFQQQRTVLAVSAPELASRGELPQTVQAIFDMNAYLARVYLNADGSRVYVEGRGTVRLSPNGDLIYSSTDGSDLKLSAVQGPERRAEICQKVYDLVCQLWTGLGASGQPSLEELRFDGEAMVLRFGLCVDGVFLEKTEGDWATVVVEDGAIVSAAASLRQLEDGETVSLLPLKLAQGGLPAGRAMLRIRLLEGADGFHPAVCRVTED